MTNSSIKVDVWGLNISVKDENYWTTYTGDLFIMVKAWIEPVTLFGWVDNRRMEHKYTMDSPKQHSAGFEFRVFPCLTSLPNYFIYTYMIVSYSGNAQRETLLQNLHSEQKLTMEHSKKKKKKKKNIFRYPHKNENGQIITDIYRKPTDTQQYHFNSYHPQNGIKSISYTLAQNIHRNHW